MEDKKRLKAYLLFFICYFSYTAIYIGRMNLSIASVSLTEGNYLSTEQIGALGTVFAVTYAVFRFVTGFIGDKYKPVFLIVIGLFLAFLSNILLSLLPHFLAMVILWCFNAIGQSMLWGAFLRVVTKIFDKEKAKKMSTVLGTAVATGNIFGVLFNTFFLEQFGLRYVFLIPSLIFLIWFIFCFIFLRKIPNTIDNQILEKSDSIGIKEVLKNKEIKLMCAPVFLHGIIKDNVSFWMTLFFVNTYGIDLKSLGIFLVFIPLVGLLARFLYLFFYKLCKNDENRLSFFMFLVSAICSVLIILLKPYYIVALICLSLIYATLSMVNTSALAIFPLKYANNNAIGTISGLMDLCAYSGYGIGSLIFGFVIAGCGYDVMFIMWAVISVLGMICIIPFLKKQF